MELMTSLLLCTLVAFLPQAPGQSRRKSSSYISEFKDSLLIKRKMGSLGSNIWVNKNSPFNMKVTDLQSIYMDPVCKGCYTCMERVMKAHKYQTLMDSRISAETFKDDHNKINVSQRVKRKVEWDASNMKKSKRSKPKKSKGISVMKYDDNGKIYALKVNETNSVLDMHNNSKGITSCNVYSVKRTVSCDSPEANVMMTGSRKNKKGKKGHGKRETKTTEPTKMIEPTKRVIIAPVYRKRNVDDSQVPEQIMPSIEEMY